MERRTIRYARRRVAGRLLEPNRAQSLWRNRMGRLYLAAPHGRTELILGVAETVPAPKAWHGDCTPTGTAHSRHGSSTGTARTDSPSPPQASSTRTAHGGG